MATAWYVDINLSYWKVQLRRTTTVAWYGGASNDKTGCLCDS